MAFAQNPLSSGKKYLAPLRTGLVAGSLLAAVMSACGGADSADGSGGSSGSGGERASGGAEASGGSGGGGESGGSGGDGGGSSGGSQSSGGTTSGGGMTANGGDGGQSSGGAAGDGGKNPMGGQGGSPEPGSCEALEEDFNDALAEARSCLAGGIVPTTECDDGISVVDLCGCPQAVSSEQTDARALIETARQAYADECVPPERCQLIDCAPKTSSGICQLTTHPNGVCVFQ